MDIRSKSNSTAGDEYYDDDDDDNDNISHHSNDENIDHGSNNNNNNHKSNNHILGSRERIRQHLGARRIEFIITAIICVIFAISFAHLEYYYIKDPALQISNGKVQVDDPNFDRSRETKPIIGNLYQYHLFPMLFIFILISFAALFDDMTFRLFGKGKRIKAFFLGCANLIAAIIVEDFAWFVNRAVLPLQDDPKGGQLMQSSDWTSMHLGALDVGGFVIPMWYLVAIILAAGAYYIVFSKHDNVS